MPYRRGLRLPWWRIQRQIKRGTKDTRFVYTWPSKKALASIKARVREITRQGTNHPLAHILNQPQPGCSGVDQLLPARRVLGDLQYLASSPGDGSSAGFAKVSSGQLEGASAAPSTQMVANGRRVRLFEPAKVAITRYRFRGAAIPSPWEPGRQGVGR